MLDTEYRELSKYFYQFPGLHVIAVIDLLLSCGLIAFSIYAGISLWLVKPGAVQITKRFLWSYLAYCGVTAILPFMAGLPAMIPEIITNTSRGAVFFAIWYSYLNKSKRVKATFEL